MLQVSLTLLGIVAIALPRSLLAQDATAARIADLEAQLRAAEARVVDLENTLASLAADVAALRATTTIEATPATTAAELTPTPGDPSYAQRVIVTDLGADNRGDRLTGRPELFIQTAYFANPIDGATEEDVTRNFAINRMELRWAGRVSERIGMGYELQYHPAPDGSTEELINDAYIEYYAGNALTIRAGQFIKPFGFDIQHSTSARESPERGMFAGYFFPGQRDRGLMVRADLGRVAHWLDGTTFYGGVFNGNRFFADSNAAPNVDLRIRKLFPSGRLALGVSLQSGTQLLPPGTVGSDDEDLYGLDLQFAVGRFGLRAEYVRGNTPSTLLALEPEFAAGFTPGERSEGAAAFFNYELGPLGDFYWRWDRFDNDPVTGNDVRAFNIGYLRRLGTSSRLAFDYQWKDGVTYNDDELNTAFTLRWDVLY